MAETLRTNGAEFSVQTEAEPTSERLLIPQADIITVSGPHYVYKTTAAAIAAGKDDDPRNQELQRMLQIQGIDFMPVGQLVRIDTERETGKPFVEAFRYPGERDYYYDTRQEKIMREVRIPHLVVSPTGEFIYETQQPVIVEGRYSGFIGAKVAGEQSGRRYAPKIERVLFWCSDEKELRDRAIERDHGKNPDLTPEQIVELAKERTVHLNQKAQALFGNLVMGQDIFSPNMVTPDGSGGKFLFGKPVYTVVIDTAGKTPHEVAIEFHQKLLENRAIKEVTRDDFSPTQAGESAFQTIRSLTRCEGLVQQYQCNRYGIKTVDLYVGGGLAEQLAACSTDDHANKIRRRVASAFASGIKFSQNGFPPNENSRHI